MSKKNNRAKSPPFTQMMHWITRSPAWRSMKPPARAVYWELRSRFNGFNNGMIGLGCREAAEAINVGPDTANRSFRELEELGFIEATTKGAFSRNGRRATEWLLTELPDDRNGHKALKTFMSWNPEKLKASPISRTVSPISRTQIQTVERITPLRPISRTQPAKSPELASDLKDTSRSTISPRPTKPVQDGEEAPPPKGRAHRTIQAAVSIHNDHARSDLSDPERSLLRWMISFQGPATHRTAQQNLSGILKGEAISAAAQSLSDRGLISIEVSGKSRTYRMLEDGYDPALLSDPKQIDLEQWLAGAVQ